MACMCAKSLSWIQLFAILWTIARQSPMSMGFPRQEYWSGLPCPPPGESSRPREDFLHLLESAGGVFTTDHLGNQQRPQNRDPPGRVLEWGKESCAHFSRGPGRTREVLEHGHSAAHGDSAKLQHKCAVSWAHRVATTHV